MITRRVYVLSILMAVYFGACTSAGPDAQTLEADASTIRDMVDRWIDYWNAGDAEGLSSLYMGDAVGMGPEAADNVGSDAMRRAFEQGLQQFTGTQSATVDEIQVEGDLAFVRGDYAVRGGAEEVEGDWLWILRRQTDGRWLIARHISNETDVQP